VEQAIHLAAKQVAKNYLKIMGFSENRIKEEVHIKVEGKTYIVDVVGEWFNHKVAIECGETEQSKLEALRRKFDFVFHLRYEDLVEQLAKIIQNYYDIKMMVRIKQHAVTKLIETHERMYQLFFNDFPIPRKLEFEK